MSLILEGTAPHCLAEAEDRAGRSSGRGRRLQQTDADVNGFRARLEIYREYSSQYTHYSI